MKYKKVIIACAAMVFASEVFAEVKTYEPISPTSESSYPGVTAISGLVFGIFAGYSNYSGSDTFTNALPASSRSSGMVNFGALFGYDQALGNMFTLGVEIDINYTPDIVTTGSTSNVSMDALNVPLMLTAKFILPIGLNIFVKGGANYQHGTCSGTFTSGSGINCNNTNEFGGVAAAGLGWQLSNFNFFGQYMYIFGDSLTITGKSGGQIAQSILTGGVTYTLPL